MLNQTIVVGRIVREPEEVEVESKKEVRITLAIPRNYKNENGEYETDFVDCILWSSVAATTLEYIHKGDLVGVKGHIESKIIEEANIMQIIAEKITFLSKKKTEEDFI